MLELTPEQIAYEAGFDAYYSDNDECPYSIYAESVLWGKWCDGHNDAYCEDEGK